MTARPPAVLTAAIVRAQLAYDPETGTFTRQKTGQIAGTPHSMGYWSISVHSKAYLGHRLAWLCVHGSWPTGVVDHINGNRQDNRIANLRDVTQSENMANAGASTRSRSGHRGVFLHPNGKWRAQVTRQRKATSLGYFETLEEAVAAYEAAAFEINARPLRQAA